MLGVLTVVFFLFNVLPGDPARMMLDQREDQEQLQNIRAKYGFDLPLYQQYFYYVNDVLPVSFHHNGKESFTHLDNKDYKYTSLCSIGFYHVVLKIPLVCIQWMITEEENT